LTLEKETSRLLARDYLSGDAMQRCRFELHANKYSLENTQVKLVAIYKIDEGEFSSALRHGSFIEGCLKLGRGQMLNLSSPSLLRWYFHERVAKTNKECGRFVVVEAELSLN
jgi:hypothetical protein